MFSFYTRWIQRVRNRRAALEMRKRLASAAVRRIVVGAGKKQRYEGWEHTDVGVLNLLKRSDWLRLGSPGFLDAILAEHVWEHLTQEEGREAARLCCEFLKPGGYLRMAVPDGGNPRPDYIARVRPGGTGPGAHDHKVLYTYRTLCAMLKEVGFEPRLLEYYDEQGELHCQDWSSKDGHIMRTSRTDERNADGVIRFTSLLVDACKPPIS